MRAIRNPELPHTLFPMELIMRRFIRATIMLGSATALAFAGVSPAQAARYDEVCMRAHVAGWGTIAEECNQEGQEGYTGTVGQNRAMEGMHISIGGRGVFCAQAHVRNEGWMPEKCASDGGDIYVGTQYENRPMEALRVRIPDGYSIRGNAHVQNVGWQGWAQGSYIQIGTVGQARHIEAVSLTLVAF
ncbi:hypothetical protein ACF05L_37500 [Streptomyces bobili]|uniref:hypothetical protein n=1 Tax=Streptomyces bobili TaxID=67280 RepID=UPI0036F7FE37